MEQASLPSARWTRAIIESAQHLMIATDPSGLVTYFNKAAALRLGYDASEVVGRHSPALWHVEEEVVRRAGELSEALERDIQPGFEVFVTMPNLDGAETRGWTFRSKDGNCFPVQLTVTCVRDESDDIMGYLGVIEDITERERLIMELQNSNEELEEFAYRTSHDLRSPLVSSISLTQVARQAIVDDDPQRATQSLALIESSLGRLEVLVADILTLTRAKRQREDAAQIDLSETIDAALKSVSHLDGFDNIEVRRSFAHKEPVVLLPSRVRLIVENLISNAIKYQDPDQAHPWLEVQTRTVDGRLLISVNDNGLGVPSAHRHKLFQMFKRLHGRVSFGSGLGLYMVKKSAQMMGGDVVFEDPGTGSSFRVELPMTQEGAT